MQEEKQEPTEDLVNQMNESGYVTLANEETVTENQEKTPERIPLTPDQRIEVLQEISVLTGVLNTVRHIPKWDMGNKGKQERKITSSIPLNFFEPQQNAQIAQRIIDLINLL